MARIEELEDLQNAKMKMEIEMEYKELSNQENLSMQEQEVKITSDQQMLLEECRAMKRE
jgi:hypothetical protein